MPIVPTPAAAHAGTGQLPAGGAARSGEGTAAGGDGAGSGTGNDGNGGGDAAWIKGRIGDSDYPPAARDARAEGVTRTRIEIDRDGRPTACSVRRSSGSALLDDTTCRLILRRFRFSPARDDNGRTVADSVDYDQSWSISGYMGD